MSVVNTLKKIVLDHRQDIFLACSYDPAKELRITLLDQDDCKAFTGHATDIDLRSQATFIRMIFNDFISLTLTALTKNEPGDNFVFTLDKNSEDFLFKWKSIDEEETIITIGNVKVIESDYSSVSKSMLCMLAKELSTLNNEVLNAKLNESKLKKELEEQLRIVSDIGDIKERIEKELYSKFMLVLNEKKTEIRNLKRTGDTALINGDRKRVKTLKVSKAHQISDSSDEDMCCRVTINTPAPSTSKHNNSLNFFDEKEPALLASPSKKRNRKKITETKISAIDEVKSEVLSPVAADSESEDELLKFM